MMKNTEMHTTACILIINAVVSQTGYKLFGKSINTQVIMWNRSECTKPEPDSSLVFE